LVTSVKVGSDPAPLPTCAAAANAAPPQIMATAAAFRPKAEATRFGVH
jgi:hypothetical protein